MARKKRGVVSAPSSTAASPSPPHGQDFGSYANQRLDASSVAALLSFEYPLIDISLVHALISDHDPASLSAHLDEIRDQLGILQATLVPDDMPGLESALSDPNTSELDHMVQGLNIRLEEDDSPPPLSAGKLKQKDRQGGLSAATVSRSSTSRRSSTSQSNGESNSGSKDERKSNWTNATSIHVEEEVSFDDEMALLQSLFQGLKEKEVREALISEGTVPAAIDYLLSLELIRDVEREGQWPGEDEGNETDDSWGHSSEEERDDRAYLADRHLSSQAPLIKQALVHSAAPDYPTLPSNATTKHPALWVSKKPSSATLSPNSSPSLRPAKVSKRKSTTVRLVDTSQRGSTPTSTRPTSRSVSPNSGRKEPKSLISGPSSNSWGSTASLAEFLSQILGQPQNYFMSWFQRPEYHSAYAAVRASLVNFPEANGKKRSSKATKGNHDGGWTTDEDKPSVKRSEDDERSQAVLEEVYGVSLLDPSESTGDKRIRSDLELCVKIMGKDVAGVMDLMDLLAEIYEWPDDDDLQRYGAVNGTTINQPSARRGSAVGGSSGPTEADVLTDEEEFQLPPPPSPKPTVSLERMITRPAPTRGVLADVAPRTVVGATAPASATLHPTAHDDFGLPSPGTSPQLNATRLMPSQRGTTSSSSVKQEHPLNWRLVKHQRKRPAVGLNHPLAASIPSYARGITPHDPTPGSLYRAPAQYSIDECLQYANSERLRRENAIRSVGKHFRSSVSGGLHLAGGKSVNGAVAGHYAIQAREATAKALEWEMKAARMIASDQLKSSRSNAVIDLHHFTINEAKTVVLEVAEKWYETERNRAFAGLEAAGMSRNRTFQPANGLTVITGVGRHSAGQKGVLGPAVQAALVQAGWRVDRDTGRGYVVVKGRR